MITHKTYKILNEYFVNILDFVEILESQFCSPWSDLSFDSIDNIEKNSSTILFIKKNFHLHYLYYVYVYIYAFAN